MIPTSVRPLPRPAEPAVFPTVLSAVLPGLGHLYQERWVRGTLMILVPPLVLLLVLAFALLAGPVAEVMVRNATLVAVLVVGTLFAYHVVVVADAFAGRTSDLGGRPPAQYAVLIAASVVLALAYVPIYQQTRSWAGVLSTVFEPPPDRTIGVGTPSASGTAAPGWSERERLNVLVLGIDTRDEAPETANTDTVIVLSLDPIGNTATMLSIPRDTLVEIPGVGPDKINAAYSHGGTGSRGGDLARRTVEDFLGITIHSYALVDFTAFRSTIDSVGGVIVDVRRPLRDDHYPTPDFGVERMRFLTGPQLMEGDEALKYARSRHDSNDFSRARRQQAVIFALRSSFARVGVFRLPGIVERVGPLVRTTFDPSDVLRLARTALAIDVGEIRSEVLLPCGLDEPHCELTEENGPTGYYLIPDPEKVRALVAELFPEPASTAP